MDSQHRTLALPNSVLWPSKPTLLVSKLVENSGILADKFGPVSKENEEATQNLNQ